MDRQEELKIFIEMAWRLKKFDMYKGTNVFQFVLTFLSSFVLFLEFNYIISYYLPYIPSFPY